MKYPIVQSLWLDPLPVASMLESAVGEYLVGPPEGIYLRGRLDPVLIAGDIYYQRELVNVRNLLDTGTVEIVNGYSNVVITSFEDIRRGSDIYDLDANVVVSAGQVPFLSPSATLPVRGIKLIEIALDALLTGYGQALLGDKRPRALVERQFSEVIHPSYRDNDQIIDLILNIVSGLRAQVRDFAGPDKWIVHFLKRDRLSFIVEKSLDFRILDWERTRSDARR